MDEQRYLLVGRRRLADGGTRTRGPLDTAALSAADGSRLAAATTAALADPGGGGWRGARRARARFGLTVLDGHGVRRLVETAHQASGTGPVPELFRLVWQLRAEPLTAAAALASLCDLVAVASPAADGDDFVTLLAAQAAGIRPGRAGWSDLATGGRDVLLGGGFRSEYDDGTPKQVRHFVGTAAAAARLGGPAARVATVLRGDLPGSPDHRLSLEAIEFVGALSAGRLAPARAGDWVRRTCAPRSRVLRVDPARCLVGGRLSTGPTSGWRGTRAALRQ